MNEWININDEMPSLGKVVLLQETYPEGSRFDCRAYPLQRNFTKLGGLRYDGIFISCEDQYSQIGLKYVSHWMELPDPPKIKE